MKLALDKDELALRDEVRAYMEEHVPAPESIPADFDERVEFLRAWQRQLHKAGLVGLNWPREYGGRSASLTEQIVVNQEMARAGAPILIGNVGLDVVGPSIVDHGSDAQKAAYLDRILSGEDIWCQGFSEVGAGSDLAALRTKAAITDEGFVINGHKVWTSYAQHAQWCAVLARTDADAPAHRGISYILVDMASPGIEIRPLVQVTGDAEFSEVYFDNVEVPAENLLGELNGGWGIAMHTLAHERGWYGVGRQVVLRVLLDSLIEEAAECEREGSAAIDDPEIQLELARAHIGIEVLKHQGFRSVGQMIAAGHPGFESSVDKLILGRVEQQMAAASLDVLGARAALGAREGDAVDPTEWQHVYLYGRAGSVYGGSAQVQKNIIAERILGLPPGAAMRLQLSEDQVELHSVAREAMASLAPLSLARSFLEGEGDAGSLRSELGELGWYAVGLEDDGFGIQGLCLLAERCGAQAAPNCLVDTAVAARLAAALDSKDELGAKVAAGEAPTALAVVEPGADWSLSALATKLSPAGEGLALTGTKLGVQHGAGVEAFLVLCDQQGESAFALVPAGETGCTVRPAPSLDTAAATVELELEGVAVPSGRALAGDAAAEAIEEAFGVGAVATAAEAVGAASAALDLAVEYSKEREQFGVPIGSFQALKHLLADAHVDRESALASVLYAAATIDEEDPGAEEAVTIAKAYASRASRSVVETALQVFGGIAFTWEHDAHLLQRRVLAAERRFGDAIQHERRLGRMLAARRQEATA